MVGVLTRQLVALLESLALIFLALSGQVAAQSAGPEAALLRLCTAAAVQAEWFTPSYLAQVNRPFVSQILLPAVQQATSLLGSEFRRCLRVEQRSVAAGSVTADGRKTATPTLEYIMLYERGVVMAANLMLDPAGRIDSVFMRVKHRFSSMDEVVRAFGGLPGNVSLLILADGRTIAAVNPETPLAIASAFKLSVLAALSKQVEAGRHSWTEVLTIRPEWKSLGSGLLQNFADNAQVTVRMATQLMIAESDNTATDLLIRLVGRDAVEAETPARNRPLLMTRDLFVLANPKNADLLARWRGGDEQMRGLVLQETQNRPLPDPTTMRQLIAQPPRTDVGWFYTVGELCTAMSRVADMIFARINPGLATRSDWAYVAYKGGSLPGVLNFTTQLESKDGKTYCVAATWNDNALLPFLRAFSRYEGVLDLLKE